MLTAITINLQIRTMRKQKCRCLGNFHVYKHFNPNYCLTATSKTLTNASDRHMTFRWFSCFISVPSSKKWRSFFGVRCAEVPLLMYTLHKPQQQPLYCLHYDDMLLLVMSRHQMPMLQVLLPLGFLGRAAGFRA